MRGRPGRSFGWFAPGVLAGMLVLSGLVGAANPDELSSEVRKAEWTLIDARARKAVREGQLAALTSGTGGPPAGNTGSADLADLLGKSELLKGKRARVKEKLQEAQKVIENEGRTVQKHWEDALNYRLEVLRAEARYEARFDCLLGSTPSIWPQGASLRQLGLWSLLALLAGLLLALFASRRQRHQRWQTFSLPGRLLRGLGLLLVFGSGGILAGWLARDLYLAGRPLLRPPGSDLRLVGFAEKLQGELTRLSGEQRKIDAEIAERDRKFDTQRRPIVEAWRKHLGFPREEDFRTFEGEPYKRLEDLLVQARRNLELAEASRQLIRDTDRLESTLTSEETRNATRVQVRGWLRVVLWGLLLVLVFGPWLLVSLRRSRQVATERQVCPHCLDQGTLREMTLGTGSSRDRGVRYLACDRCEYRLPRSYRHLPRLCFPTVGVIASGKTHWLVEAYHLIGQGQIPAGLSLARIPSREDNRCDALIEAIWQQQRGPNPTGFQEGNVPYPLLFEFRDRSGEREGAIVNLFDFAGEMATVRIDASALRRRALGMDGFVLILDPTRAGDLRQQRALEDFCKELRHRCDIPPEQPIPVPVAVCLTKLDLLPGRRVGSGWGLHWLQQMRDLPRDPAQLATLEARSNLVSERIPTLFQGWNVLQTLAEQFGDNYLFFPVTPVGIDEEDEVLLRLPEGPASLKDRNFAPFGILEPILWLLHRHGFEVFQ